MPQFNFKKNESPEGTPVSILNINKLEANIRKLYLYWFFNHLIFAYVIERLFGLERGINIQQMIYIEIIYAVVVMVLEIPTGVLADKWSRKNTLIISSFFTFFEIFILIFAHSFIMFSLSSISAAIAGALASGTSNALFYDSLKLTGKEDQFEKIIGRNNFYSSIAGTIAPLFGSIIAARMGYTSTYWFSLVGIVIGFFISFTFYEPEIRQGNPEDGEEQSGFDFRKAINFLRKSSSVRFMMLAGVILGSAITYVDEYWQIYLKEVNFPVEAFGVYAVFYSLIMSATGIFSYRLKNISGYKTIFTVCILFTGLSITCSSLIFSGYGIIPLLAAALFFGLTEPLTAGYIHNHTASIHRATVESFFSFALRLVTVITGLLFGYISTNYSIFAGFTLLGLMVLGYFIYYAIFQFKYLK